jgi:CheY-like chemotaxis protein
MILRSMGIDATAFNRPLDALEAAKVNPPDLLLTDVVMPFMTGIELAILVKKSCPDCKVLLFSGQALNADLLHDVKSAGHEFEILTKPVHPTDLLAKIRLIAPDSLSA